MCFSNVKVKIEDVDQVLPEWCQKLKKAVGSADGSIANLGKTHVGW